MKPSSPPNAVTDKIVAFLNGHHADFKLSYHEDTPTSELASHVRARDTGLTPEQCLARGAKSMILRSDSKHYQFVLPGNRKIDFKKVKTILGSRSTSLATAEEVFGVTGCQIGGVPPFGNLFNLPVYLDKSMLANEYLDCNAGSSGVSLTMSVCAYVNVVKPTVADFAVEEKTHTHA